MTETDSNVVLCPTVGDKHWMFGTRFAAVVYQSHIFLFGGTTDYIMTNIDYMCWVGKNGRTMILFTNL